MNRLSKLEKVFELFINGEIKESEEMLRNVILDIAAETNQKLAEQEEVIEYVERDMGDDLADDITDDLEEIEAEEMYDDLDVCETDEDVCEDDMSIEDAEDDLAVDLADNSEDVDMDLDIEDEVEDLADRVEDVEDKMEDHEAKFEELCKEFEKLQAEEEIEHEDEDMDMEVNMDMEESVEESVDLETVKVKMDDKSEGGNSPVLDHDDMIEFEGEAVKVSKKDSAVSTDEVKVKEMDGGNTVKDADKALIKESADGARKIKESIVKKAKK